MIIQISNLRDGDYHFTFDKKVEEIGLSVPFFDNIIVDSLLQKSQRQIILNSKLKTNVIFECDRCGTEYTQELTNNFKIVYLYSSEIYDKDEIDIKYISFEADTINITLDVRDYALLAIPMKKLCKKDCKGLCITCGKNLNEVSCNCKTAKVDPRWAPLEKLKNKVN